MKTPDEIKKTLVSCKPGLLEDCGECCYEKESECCAYLAGDALAYIRELESDLEQAQQVTAGFEIMLTSAQSDAETWKRRAKAIQRDFGEFAARINAGEDLMACEYCKKNYAEGECNCNCLKNFERSGPQEDA